jgi:N6-adenosine-specific RNA methylase IME4
MAKYNVIVADPPWIFSDKLKMNSVKRGASSNYDVLNDQDIINLNIKSIVADDAMLVLWVPSSKLQAGLDTMKAWGFEQTQTFVWVKTKKAENILKPFKKDIKSLFNSLGLISRLSKPITLQHSLFSTIYKDVCGLLDKFDLNESLGFFMGRLFRQTHEIALVGKKGKIYSKLKNRSQRSVLLNVSLKHSSKPDGLQDRLDIMFPDKAVLKLELFARRDRLEWTTCGWECPSTLKEDVRDSIKRLEKV